MKKLILAVAVLILCSYSFAQTPNSAKVNAQLEAAAAFLPSFPPKHVPEGPKRCSATNAVLGQQQACRTI